MSAEEALFQRFAQNCVKGTVLFREGEPGRDVYVLQSGKISITKKVGDREILLATLNAGEFFGELAPPSSRTQSCWRSTPRPSRT